MKADVNEMILNGVVYVPKSEVQGVAEPLDGMPYVIIRTYSAGVFAGYLKRREGKEVELVQARRIWYWKGAASLSQMAVDGVSCPNECKFPAAVNVTVTQAIEIISCTEKARVCIEGVPEWKK